MSSRGNALFLILIAVALFAALSYAVTNSGGGGGGGIEKEQAKLDQAVMDNYMAELDAGRMRLEIINHCDSIDYTAPADQTTGDKTCFMFHPDGGGVLWRDMGLNGCTLAGIELSDLAIGDDCGDIVYAGSVSGKRLYTSKTNQATSLAWASADNTTGITDTSNGMQNTNDLLALDDGTTYLAAELCRSLGSEWYLPAIQELNQLFNARNTGSLAGTFAGYYYWSSSEISSQPHRAKRINFDTSQQNISDKTYSHLQHVRCVRSD